MQLRKAQGVWGRLSRVMRAENASPRVCGLFYKATVQAVLLFGSETWCLSPANLRLLEGFHVRAARRMTGMMPKKKSDGSWEYPDSAEVLKAACLHTVVAVVHLASGGAELHSITQRRNVNAEERFGAT